MCNHILRKTLTHKADFTLLLKKLYLTYIFFIDCTYIEVDRLEKKETTLSSTLVRTGQRDDHGHWLIEIRPYHKEQKSKRNIFKSKPPIYSTYIKPVTGEIENGDYLQWNLSRFWIFLNLGSHRAIRSWS